MNIKTFFILAIIIIVIAGIIFFFQDRGEKTDSGGDSAGLLIGKSAIYAAEQIPGNKVLVSIVRLEKPGFAAIHEDAAGAIDGILGVSGLLLVGETKNLPPIALSRETKDGETIYAMLHFDDGDGKFDAVKDKPALDSMDDAPIMMIVVVSKDADEPGIVNP